MIDILEKSEVITSKLFEAYVTCPTKCYLQSIGETTSGNSYTVWRDEQCETYLLNAIQQLIADRSKIINSVPSAPNHWRRENWDYVLTPVVHTKDFEATPHAVQRHIDRRNSKSILFVPVRYIPENKISKVHKLVAAFDSFVISKTLGKKIGPAIIIHGDKRSKFTEKAYALSGSIRKTVNEIISLLSGSCPPNIILNRHCPECGYQNLCRNNAVKKNDLSLLGNLPAKEIERLNHKGIFTVHQLSFTFRPRRRSKRLAVKPEKFHPSLKALAIRERKIHLVGEPQLNIDGTPIYLDIEGLPDRDFYYLVGLRVEEKRYLMTRYFWADTEADEKTIWESFLDIVSSIDHPILIHYGSFESTYFKRMCNRYGDPPEDSPAAIAIASSINILSVIYAKVYFPTFSNSLKEIAKYLGFQWSDQFSSGLLSIAWRHQWESSHSPSIRKKLITYNAEDCKALSIVAHTLTRIIEPIVDNDGNFPSEIVQANLLSKSRTSKWRVFKSSIQDFEYINEAAHWDYQHDRVFVRTGLIKRNRKHYPKRNGHLRKPEIIVTAKTPTSVVS